MSQDSPLGRLERVDLRNVWLSEAQDFTPWLAREENLSVLAETLMVELELEAQERNVGPFRADILCKNTEDDSWVLIENQLERTDHSHLGQLLTYAAGLHAVHVIGGAVIMLIIAAAAKKGQALHRVELIGIYWHFVDLVWIFLFPLLYIAK